MHHTCDRDDAYAAVLYMCQGSGRGGVAGHKSGSNASTHIRFQHQEQACMNE